MAADMANLKNWRFHVDFDGIAWATFDVQGQSQNTLGREPLTEHDVCRGCSVGSRVFSNCTASALVKA